MHRGVRGEQKKNEKSIPRKNSMIPKEFEILKKFKTRVTKMHPEMEILHPTTFENISAQDIQNKEHQTGEKVNVVVWKGKAYLI